MRASFQGQNILALGNGIARLQSPPLVADTAEQPQTQTTFVAKARTILVVDDEPTLRVVAADFLTDKGFEVVEAGSADEAIAVLEHRADVALIFTDVKMPGSADGIGLATIASMRWPHIQLVVTSGKLQPSHRPLPHKANFLSKPYNLAAIARLAEPA